MSTIDNPCEPNFDVCEFRKLVARYVKLMVRARWLHDRGFLKQEELGRWKLEDIGDDRRNSWQLVAQAASTLGLLNREFLPRCGSGGVAETDPTSPVGRLIDEISFFVEPSGGGPEHNQKLTILADRLKEGATVAWESVASWESLQVIRDDLDLLPETVSGESDRRSGQSIFRRNGPDFEIAYRDGPLQVHRPLKGLFYIAFLLENPEKRYSGTNLRSEIDKKKNRRSMAAPRDISPSCNHGNSFATVVDEQSLAEYRKRLAEIRDEIDEAQEISDQAAVLRLEDEHERIRDHVRKSIDHKGNPRQISNPEKNARDSVIAAIKTALKAIRSKAPEAFEHLDASLRYDDGIYYSPAVQIDWEIYF